MNFNEFEKELKRVFDQLSQEYMISFIWYLKLNLLLNFLNM